MLLCNTSPECQYSAVKYHLIFRLLYLLFLLLLICLWFTFYGPDAEGVRPPTKFRNWSREPGHAHFGVILRRRVRPPSLYQTWSGLLKFNSYRGPKISKLGRVTQATPISVRLHHCTKFEEDSSFRSKVIKKKKIFRIDTRSVAYELIPF